jgi:hypothetical protein
MAMACFRDLTLAPLPLRSVPRFFLRIALSTRFEAAFPYFRVPRRARVRFVAGMAFSRKRCTRTVPIRGPGAIPRERESRTRLSSGPASTARIGENRPQGECCADAGRCRLVTRQDSIAFGRGVTAQDSPPTPNVKWPADASGRGDVHV